MTLRTLCCFLFLAPFVFAQPESLPDRFTIPPESQGPALMRQCSRLAPRDVSGFWSPSAAQVPALEQRLPDLLRKKPTEDQACELFSTVRWHCFTRPKAPATSIRARNASSI